MRFLLVALLVLIPAVMAAAGAAPPVIHPALALEPDPQARFRFEGPVGERVRANTRAWLIAAPEANPGMLEMFRVRDRLPKPNLVPWAGEFVGKYLISAVQALRMDPDPELKGTVQRVVRELCAAQAEDGYLGPFTRAERLRGHWDLWGHYHCMLGLLMWHEMEPDPAALRATRRAADLICATFLDGKLRVYDAGSHEMNMAVIHGLGRLYRLTGEPRYLRMMREIEKDWERAGDYLRTGVEGIPFFQTPRPRWESLHDLQGLVELYQITGEEQYRKAFESHWRSIRLWDRRNTGGFSSGEQATGDPYAPTPIETCCTVSWMALSLDMLRLTGEPQAADELEISTYNGGLGAQHPSGRWWTYSTPMDGVREASAHSIVFQARAGTPELNCCSVNGPRILGMLSEWTVMRDAAGLAVNFYAPGVAESRLADGTRVTLKTESEYPRTGEVKLRIEPERRTRFRLRLRIPAWEVHAAALLNGKAVAGVTSGRYLEIEREWKKGDTVRLSFTLPLRVANGDGDALGRISLYRGPVLLTYDQALNSFDENAVPALDAAKLPVHIDAEAGPRRGAGDPWVLVTLAAEGKPLRLCDYASAGASGTRYRSWLPVKRPLPPHALPRMPRDGAEVPAGRLLFRWTGPSRPNAVVHAYSLRIRDGDEVVLNLPAGTNRLVLTEEQAARLRPARLYTWEAHSTGPNGSASGAVRARFTVNLRLPRLTDLELHPATGVLVSASLANGPESQKGKLLAAEGYRTVNGALELDGVEGRLKYAVEAFPEEEYTVAVRVRFNALPQGRLGQVFSAWTAPSDDPLRLVIDGGKLYARIEAGGSGASTSGVVVQTGRWYALAAVKEGSRLTLYVDGVAAAQGPAPFSIRSNTREVALGGNPRFTGNEFLTASFADFSLHGRALAQEEVRALLPPR